MKNPAIFFTKFFPKGLGRKRQSLEQHTPFKVMVEKEMTDLIRSWRFIVLIALIVLTFIASMYVSVRNIKTAITGSEDPSQVFLYLKLLTTTDNSIPPFHVFVSFLGPLLGISMGFDAINAETNNGTLIRLMAQPIYRDNLLLAKFISSLIVIVALFLSLALLMIGSGLLITGVRMEPQELIRIIAFIIFTVVYIGFWLALSILLSVKFKQATTSALTAIGIWLFFTVFYPIVVNLFVRFFLPDPTFLSRDEMARYNENILHVLHLAPGQLYSDATTTLLIPTVRSIGPLSMEQLAGALPSPLPFKESFLIVWPQISGLLAVTAVCFAVSYYLFMRREIRS